MSNIWGYNEYMGHHWDSFFRFNPREAKKAENQVWNSFVAFTHRIGLRSFKFTPQYYDPSLCRCKICQEVGQPWRENINN